MIVALVWDKTLGNWGCPAPPLGTGNEGGWQQQPRFLMVLDCIPGINGKYFIVPFVSIRNQAGRRLNTRPSLELTGLFLQLREKSHSVLAINIRQDTPGFM